MCSRGKPHGCYLGLSAFYFFDCQLIISEDVIRPQNQQFRIFLIPPSNLNKLSSQSVNCKSKTQQVRVGAESLVKEASVLHLSPELLKAWEGEEGEKWYRGIWQNP